MPLTKQQMRALKSVQIAMNNAAKFIGTNEKMTTVGIDLYLRALRRLDILVSDLRAEASDAP